MAKKNAVTTSPKRKTVPLVVEPGQTLAEALRAAALKARAA